MSQPPWCSVDGVRAGRWPRRARAGRRGRRCGRGPRPGSARPRTGTATTTRRRATRSISASTTRRQRRAAGARAGAPRRRCRRCGRPAGRPVRPRPARAPAARAPGRPRPSSRAVPGHEVDGRHPVPVGGQPQRQEPEAAAQLDDVGPSGQRGGPVVHGGHAGVGAAGLAAARPARRGCCGRRRSSRGSSVTRTTPTNVVLEAGRVEQAGGDEVVGDPVGEVVAELVRGRCRWPTVPVRRSDRVRRGVIGRPVSVGQLGGRRSPGPSGRAPRARGCSTRRRRAGRSRPAPTSSAARGSARSSPGPGG